MIEGIQFGNLMIDCADEALLCTFYENMLGWQRRVLFGRPALISESGLVVLFSHEEDYVSPVWPEEENRQQKQIHLDFQVPDVSRAVEEAIRLGAKRAEAQFGDEADDFVTMFDPAGHPFCLCASSNQG